MIVQDDSQKYKMSDYIEGLVFGDFSALESEERAKIDHVLRDGSNAVELYWSYQENGLHLSTVPNGPSSLSVEEKERIEQQKLLDIASSLQNLPDFNSSSVASAVHYSNTELSLTPENNFVFRADTPPTFKEDLRTGQAVPEGAVQIGFENKPGPCNIRNPERQLPVNDVGPNPNFIEEKQQRFVAPPESVNVQPQIEESGRIHQSGHYQPHLQSQPFEAKLAQDTAYQGNKGTDSDGSNNANGSSQKVDGRRNKKKRPPNYYENRERANIPNDMGGITGPPEFKAGSGGIPHLPNNVNNIPPPVNMLPQQNLSQNVPLQNFPPEVMAQIMHANQQQYVQYISNCLAQASMDPQFAQQQHQQQQQQMAIHTVNALIQQGTLPGMFMQVPPPQIMHHLMGQMPPGQVPMQPDTRIPPPNIEGPADESRPKYAPPMLHMDHSQQKRHSVERQFQPNHQTHESGRDFSNTGKQPDNTRFVHSRENKSHNRDTAHQNHGHDMHVRPSPPKQVLPPTNNVKYEHTPNVPQRQEQPVVVEQTIVQNAARKEDRDFEAQKQLQESIEKVTLEYQELQKNESIRKLIEPEKAPEALRTEDCDTKVTAEKVFEASDNQSEQSQTLSGEKQDITEDTSQKSQVSDSSAKEVNCAPDVPKDDQPVVLSEEKIQDAVGQKGAEEISENADQSSVDGNSSSATVVSQQTEPQTQAQSAASVASQPDIGQNNSKPGVWGSKPAGAWAALFKNEAKGVVIYANNQQGNSSEGVKKNAEGEESIKEGTPEKPVPAAEDKAAKQLGDILLKHEINHRPYPTQTRGLVNRGNWCYVNATLQALLACPPFCHLMKALPSFPPLSRGPTSTPVIDSLIEFVSEFGPMQMRNEKNDPKGKQSAKLSSKDIQPGIPFEPIGVYKMLHLMKYDAEFKHGRQEDAEEFLTCVLNGLHDEMVAAVNVVTGKGDEPEPKANGDVEAPVEEGQENVEDDDQWEKVGPKNKSVITRSAKISESPIAKIFGGQLRSILHQQGSKESATLEPFFTLQLDVHNPNVWDVKQALDSLVSKESLQGYTCAKTKVEVEATRRILLEELPPVLILHLKWFIYNKSGGMQKHPKNFGFEEKLELSKELLSQNARARFHVNQRTYKLFAVVNHHGARAIGGHYTTFVYHPGMHGWIHQDDSTVKTVNLSQVLKLDHPRVPYLLYYRRVDVSS